MLKNYNIENKLYLTMYKNVLFLMGLIKIS
jgi:hypothetical protein